MIPVNWQWAVTESGIEAVEGTTSPSVVGLTSRYVIYSDKLLDTTRRGNHTFYEWPIHMAEKTWVDVTAFNQAFERAISYHLEDGMEAVNLKMLQASFQEAANIKARS